jgi:hypothetical protein
MDLLKKYKIVQEIGPEEKVELQKFFFNYIDIGNSIECYIPESFLRKLLGGGYAYPFIYGTFPNFSATYEFLVNELTKDENIIVIECGKDNSAISSTSNDEFVERNVLFKNRRTGVSEDICNIEKVTSDEVIISKYKTHEYMKIICIVYIKKNYVGNFNELYKTLLEALGKTFDVHGIYLESNIRLFNKHKEKEIVTNTEEVITSDLLRLLFEAKNKTVSTLTDNVVVDYGKSFISNLNFGGKKFDNEELKKIDKYGKYDYEVSEYDASKIKEEGGYNLSEIEIAKLNQYDKEELKILKSVDEHQRLLRIFLEKDDFDVSNFDDFLIQNGFRHEIDVENSKREVSFFKEKNPRKRLEAYKKNEDQKYIDEEKKYSEAEEKKVENILKANEEIQKKQDKARADIEIAKQKKKLAEDLKKNVDEDIAALEIKVGNNPTLKTKNAAAYSKLKESQRKFQVENTLLKTEITKLEEIVKKHEKEKEDNKKEIKKIAEQKKKHEEQLKKEEQKRKQTWKEKQITKRNKAGIAVTRNTKKGFLDTARDLFARTGVVNYSVVPQTSSGIPYDKFKNGDECIEYGLQYLKIKYSGEFNVDLCVFEKPMMKYNNVSRELEVENDFMYIVKECQVLSTKTPESVNGNRYIIWIIEIFETSLFNKNHYNVMIYDTETNFVERFNPHQQKYTANNIKLFDQQQLNTKISNYFKENDWVDVNFYPLTTDSFYDIVNKKYDLDEDIKYDMCCVWCIWYIDTRLSNLSYTREQVLSYATSMFWNKKDFQNFILKYKYFLENSKLFVDEDKVVGIDISEFGIEEDVVNLAKEKSGKNPKRYEENEFFTQEDEGKQFDEEDDEEDYEEDDDVVEGLVLDTLDDVKVMYNGKWRVGFITRVNDGDKKTYNVKLRDYNNILTNLDKNKIKLIEKHDPTLKKDDVIDVKFAHKWYSGIVKNVNDDGTYNVLAKIVHNNSENEDMKHAFESMLNNIPKSKIRASTFLEEEIVRDTKAEDVFCDNLKALHPSPEDQNNYVNSVVFALFAVPNDVNKKFLDESSSSDIQGELLKIEKYIRNQDEESYDSSTLIDVFKARENSTLKLFGPKFYSNVTRDAGDFLSFLIYNLSNTQTLYYQHKISGFVLGNLELLEEEKSRQSIVWDIDPILLNFDENLLYTTDTLRKKTEFVTVKTQIQGEISIEKVDEKRIIDSPYIIFNVKRRKVDEDGKEEELDYKIFPDKTITLVNKKSFRLNAIVVYGDNRYKTYFRCGKLWFQHDGDIKYIGPYEEMLEQNPSPIIKGSLYFYVSEKKSKDEFDEERGKMKNRNTGKKSKKDKTPKKSQTKKDAKEAKFECDNMKGLEWVGNSCYLDSVLFALFAVPNKITPRFLEDHENSPLQEELLKMIEYMRNGTGVSKNCSDFRVKLQEENAGNVVPFATGNMQDAGEFLLYLVDQNRLKNVGDMLTCSENIYGSNDDGLTWVLETNRIFSSSIVWNIESSILESMNINSDNHIRDLTTKTDIYEIDLWKYGVRKDENKIIDSDYIIFNIIRKKKINDTKVKFLTHKIIPDETIVLENGKQLSLNSIVVYKNAHYQAYIKCGGKWYRYNDTSDIKVTLIGSYKNMLRSEPSPYTQGTLYFYIAEGEDEEEFLTPEYYDENKKKEENNNPSLIPEVVEGKEQNKENKSQKKENKSQNKGDEKKKKKGDENKGDENKGDENKGDENKREENKSQKKKKGEENKREEKKGEEKKGDEKKGEKKKEKKEEEVNVVENFCDNLRGLSFDKNSCYLDSVIFALFAVPNDINSKFLEGSQNVKIQEELLRITNYIRNPSGRKGKYNCRNLRNIFGKQHKANSTDQKFFTGDMQDAGEFLMYLVARLGNTDILKYLEIIRGSNISENGPWRQVKKEENSGSFVWNVQQTILQKLSSNEDHDIQQFLTKTDIDSVDGWSHKFKMETQSVIDSPYIVFNILRKIQVNGQDEYLDTRIVPNNEIILSNRRKLYLNSIIVHKDNHYIAYFRCKKHWYVYDDKKEKVSRVGLYANMLSSDPSPLTRGTLYFYISSQEDEVMYADEGDEEDYFEEGDEEKDDDFRTPSEEDEEKDDDFRTPSEGDEEKDDDFGTPSEGDEDFRTPSEGDGEKDDDFRTPSEGDEEKDDNPNEPSKGDGNEEEKDEEYIDISSEEDENEPNIGENNKKTQSKRSKKRERRLRRKKLEEEERRRLLSEYRKQKEEERKNEEEERKSRAYNKDQREEILRRMREEEKKKNIFPNDDEILKEMMRRDAEIKKMKIKKMSEQEKMKKEEERKEAKEMKRRRNEEMRRKKEDDDEKNKEELDMMIKLRKREEQERAKKIKKRQAKIKLLQEEEEKRNEKIRKKEAKRKLLYEEENRRDEILETELKMLFEEEEAERIRKEKLEIEIKSLEEEILELEKLHEKEERIWKEKLAMDITLLEEEILRDEIFLREQEEKRQESSEENTRELSDENQNLEYQKSILKRMRNEKDVKQSSRNKNEISMQNQIKGILHNLDNKEERSSRMTKNIILVEDIENEIKDKVDGRDHPENLIDVTSIMRYFKGTLRYLSENTILDFQNTENISNFYEEVNVVHRNIISLQEKYKSCLSILQLFKWMIGKSLKEDKQYEIRNALRLIWDPLLSSKIIVKKYNEKLEELFEEDVIIDFKYKDVVVLLKTLDKKNKTSELTVLNNNYNGYNALQISEKIFALSEIMQDEMERTYDEWFYNMYYYYSLVDTIKTIIVDVIINTVSEKYLGVFINDFFLKIEDDFSIETVERKFCSFKIDFIDVFVDGTNLFESVDDKVKTLSGLSCF